MEGDKSVDILMIPVSKAIKKHIKNREAFTEIYNRAYEAILASMVVKDGEIERLKKMLHERNGGWL